MKVERFKTARRVVSMIAVMGLSVAGCAHQSAERVPTDDRESIVKGTVTYRERMALPPDAAIEVWISDVSPLILGVPLVAEVTLRAEGRQVPIPFELHYDPSRVNPDNDYAVKAVIRSGGEILFQTEATTAVITKGRPREVTLWLVRAELDSDGTEGRPVGGLERSSWRLVDLGGTGVLDRAEATLEFPEAGRISGNGSCNRFFGTVEILGESIQISPLGSTRMACAEAVGRQEEKYFRALEGAERFKLDGSTLLVYCEGLEKPLRFVSKER